VSTAAALIEQAFEKLAARPGFTLREDQKQLALLLSDMIEGGSRGAFEAPTGLGKSLAALIPAIAHATISGKRTVVATYTNVLAEQYWRQDLPLALSLFEVATPDKAPTAQFLIGRQRYACLSAILEHAPELMRDFAKKAELGIETELRQIGKKSAREIARIWPQIAAPPVCPGRLCDHYNACFYYKARRQADSAEIVITNHSVVIQDALMKRTGEGDGLLGQFDFLILDEAHDFPQAAINGLEFELSQPKLGAVAGLATRLEKLVAPIAQMAGDMMLWASVCEEFRKQIERCQRAVLAYSLRLGQPGILKASPDEVMNHPQVEQAKTRDGLFGAQRIAEETCNACVDFAKDVQSLIDDWKERGQPLGVIAESVRTYLSYIREYGAGCYTLFTPEGVAVSYVGRSGQDAMLRSDLIGLAEPLTEMIWDRQPYACLSATLALDGNFDFFRRTTGAKPDF
jgi:Rad3-related DNA helicase